MDNIIKKARDFAYEKHSGQQRKGNNKPFTSHLDKAVEVVETMTNDNDIIAATWLHDVVEDTNTSLKEIYSLFGKRIGRLVELESENKRPHINERESWKVRKEEQIKELKNIPKEDSEVFMIALADKLANTEEMLELKNEKGLSFWNKFNNSDPKEQEWYYQSFADIIHSKSNLSDTRAYKRYIEVLNELFERVI